MNANHTLPAAKLPLRTVGVGRAYRAEAGARGLDSKGLYRVHEFTKVEMFLPFDKLHTTANYGSPTSTSILASSNYTQWSIVLRRMPSTMPAASQASGITCIDS